MARRKVSKKSLKISRKKKPKVKVARKRLVIKVSKFNRLLKKARVVSKKALKEALKGTTISKITDRTCKKIDAAVAKDPAIATIIQNAIVSVVNTMTAVKAPKTKKIKTPEASAETPKKKTKTAPEAPVEAASA